MNTEQKIDVVMALIKESIAEPPSKAEIDVISLVLSEIFTLGDQLENIAASLRTIAQAQTINARPPSGEHDRAF
jgi:hypothetical protein